MSIARNALWAIAATLLVTADAPAASAQAERPFVWLRAGDALTLDPHAVNEGTTHTLSHQIYEPLIVRDHVGQLVPALAVSWSRSNNPLVWHFDLRQGVTFHDGTKLTAEDVIFSLKRAMEPTSDLATRLQAVEKIEPDGPNRIAITTHVRDPLLPIQLTDIFIMSKAWATAHAAQHPLDYAAGQDGYAATHANGTGPYRLVERDPGIVTRLERYPGYWGWPAREPGTTSPRTVAFKPVADVTARLKALTDGKADFVQDVPSTDLTTLRQTPGIKLRLGPENRVIFLALSVRPTFEGHPNLLADPRVREAIALTIDRLAIQRQVMFGQSIPTAVLAPPRINGFPDELDQIPERNPEKARELVSAAVGNASRALTLDCPDNRYVNDREICNAVAGQLAEIGLDVTPALRPKTEHFARVRSGESQFYLLGWGVPTFDSAYIFLNLVHAHTANLGSWNGTGYANPELDRKIEAVARLTETGERQRMVLDIWRQLDAERIYVPLHVQTLIYATRDNVDVTVDVSNMPRLKDVVIKTTSEANPVPPEAGE